MKGTARIGTRTEGISTTVQKLATDGRLTDADQIAADGASYQRQRVGVTLTHDLPYNGDFEQFPDSQVVADGWTKDFEVFGVGSYGRSTSPYRGTYAQELRGGNVGVSVASRPFGVKEGVRYTFRVRAKIDDASAASDGFYFRILWYSNDDDLSRFSASFINSNDIVDGTNNSFTVNNAYSLFTGEVLAPAGAKFCRIALYCWTEPAAPRIITVDTVAKYLSTLSLSDAGITGKSADNIAEAATRKWAGESGADVTSGHIAADTAAVAGTAAATVRNQAASGQTSYDGTLEYRKVGAPTNAPAPSAIATATNPDGSFNVTLGWSAYTQGAVKANGLIIFYKLGAAPLTAPTVTDPSVKVPLGATSHTFLGLNQADNFRFGIAAYRNSENGIDVGAIQAPTAAPNWADVTIGIPTFKGLVSGGGNEAKDSSFEYSAFGVDYWTVYNSGPEGSTQGFVATSPYHGAKHYRITWTVPNTSSKGIYALTGNLNFKANKTYVLSWYAKATIAIGSGMQLAWNTFPAATVLLLNPNLSTAYQRYAFKITWGASVDPNMFITIIFGGGQPANDLDIDAIQVEEGENLTGYSENPTEGQGAFAGTVQYRKSGAPSNVPVPAGISTKANTDGSADITLTWSAYTQGAVKAAGIIVYVKRGTAPLAVPTDADPQFKVSIDATSFTVYGVSPADNYRFGIAAYRYIETGIIRTAIQAPTSAPNWADITVGTPNFTGNVDGTAAGTVRGGADRANAGLDTLGDLARDIKATVKVAGRTEGISTTVQKLATDGRLTDADQIASPYATTFRLPHLREAVVAFANLDFEAGGSTPTGADSGWYVAGGDPAHFTYETVSPLAGSRSLKIYSPIGVQETLQNKITVVAKPGEVFYVQATGKVDTAGTQVRIVCVFRDKNGTDLGYIVWAFTSTATATLVATGIAPTNAVYLALSADNFGSTTTGYGFIDQIVVRKAQPTLLYHKTAGRVVATTDRTGSTNLLTWDTVASYTIHLPPGSTSYQGRMVSIGGTGLAANREARIKVGTQVSSSVNALQTPATLSVSGLTADTDITIEIQGQNQAGNGTVIPHWNHDQYTDQDQGHFQ